METRPSASIAGIKASSMAPMPSQSITTLRGGGRNQGMMKAIEAKASAASGRIDQNTQRQLKASTISPPSKGTDQAADSEDRREDAHVLGPLGWREQVAGDRERIAHQDAAADALERAEADQHLH